VADEKAAAADTSAAEEAAYKAELAERVKRGVEEMGISTEEKPTEPAKEEPAKEDPETEDSEETEESEGEDTEAEEEKPEGKYSKAFRKLQKQEAELQQFKSQILQQERELKQRYEKQQANEAELGQFIRQLQLDPFGTLMKAGLLNEDDAEYASKQLYFHSKAAAADPKSKLEAERLRRERQVLLEAQQTRREVEELRREREKERTEAQKQASLNGYISKIDSTVESYKAKTPLLAKALEKNPTRTRQELLQIANDLSYAKQEFADPSLVILAWVKQRKQLLADHGITEPVAKSEQAKSKTAAEKKGPTDGKSTKSAQSSVVDDEAAEAAFQKELRERLNGTYAGDD
jgi:hypothetical protein